MAETITGSNGLEIKHHVSGAIKEFKNKHGDLSVEQFDGEKVTFEQLKDAVQSVPFLASRKMVVVRDLSANKDVADKVHDIIALASDTTDLLLVETKLDKRSIYYKTVKKETDYKEFAELDAYGLAKWLTDKVKKLGGDMNSRDAQYLIERVGANQMLLSNELDKLFNYSPKITHETINLLTDKTPHSSTFDLLDAAFGGNTLAAMRLYEEQRQQKVEPQAILGLIAWQLHLLAVAKTAESRPDAEIAKDIGASPYTIRKSRDAVRSITIERIKKMVAEALRLDIRLKSEPIDADDALKLYILKLSA